jgi:hypothetical protein
MEINTKRVKAIDVSVGSISGSNLDVFAASASIQKLKLKCGR